MNGDHPEDSAGQTSRSPEDIRLRPQVKESLSSRGRRVASGTCNARGGVAWNSRAKEVEAGRMNHGAHVHGLEDWSFSWGVCKWSQSRA